MTERYINKAFRSDLNGMWRKRIRKARLLIYPDENVPEEIMRNISHQIRQHKIVPVRLEDFTPEEIEVIGYLAFYLNFLSNARHKTSTCISSIRL